MYNLAQNGPNFVLKKSDIMLNGLSGTPGAYEGERVFNSACAIIRS